MSNIMDYYDQYPGQYEGDQQRYARGMDDYHRKLDMVSLRKYGRHYDDLEMDAKKDVENRVSLQRKGDASISSVNGLLMEETIPRTKRSNISNIITNRLTRGV